MTAVW
jgi:hypothetical protein